MHVRVSFFSLFFFFFKFIMCLVFEKNSLLVWWDKYISVLFCSRSHVLTKLALVGIIPNQILISFREHATRIRKTLGSIPGGAALCFSSDLIDSSSIFVGAEREENLIMCWLLLFNFFKMSSPQASMVFRRCWQSRACGHAFFPFFIFNKISCFFFLNAKDPHLTTNVSASDDSSWVCRLPCGLGASGHHK